MRKPEGKIPLERRSHRWEDNIKMDCKEIGCGLNSSGSEHSPDTGSCEHGNELLVSVKCGEFLDLLSDYEFHKELQRQKSKLRYSTEQLLGCASRS
jgi:hypothetical protein